MEVLDSEEEGEIEAAFGLGPSGSSDAAGHRHNMT